MVARFEEFPDVGDSAKLDRWADLFESFAFGTFDERVLALDTATGRYPTSFATIEVVVLMLDEQG